MRYALKAFQVLVAPPVSRTRHQRIMSQKRMLTARRKATADAGHWLRIQCANSRLCARLGKIFPSKKGEDCFAKSGA